MPPVFSSLVCYSAYTADDVSRLCMWPPAITNILLHPDAWLITYVVLVVVPLLMLARNEKFKIAQATTALVGNVYLVLSTCLRFYFGHYRLNWSEVVHNLTTIHLNLAYPRAEVL